MRVLSFAVPLLAVAGTILQAQTQTVGSDDVKLKAATVGDQTVFHIGERITLELTYSAAPAARAKYNVSTGGSALNGRSIGTEFEVLPAVGFEDPLRAYFSSFTGFAGSILMGLSPLLATPITMTRDLNEWVRFEIPGTYRVTVRSTQVQPARRALNDTPLEIKSNEITLKIVPATPEWQRATLSEAIEQLKTAPSAQAGSGLVSDVRGRAAATLRYLGTAAAAEEMAERIDDETYGFNYLLGLASTPARTAAIEKLEQMLSDPSTPVSDRLIEAISLVKLPPDLSTGRSERREQYRQEAMEELLRVVSQKRGRARAVSLFTVIDSIGVRSGELPPEEKRELSEGIVAGFDDLTTSQQQMLLAYRWNLLDASVTLPLLEKLARRQATADQPELNEESGSALLRWWQADPAGARPTMLQEIMRPQPRFGIYVLGVLPDKTLPEADGPLLEHLKANAGSEDRIAALIGRYATGDIESGVTDYLEPRIGKVACAEQASLLGYLLRVDPESGVDSAKKAVNFPGCNHQLLMDVSRVYHAAALQAMAVANLHNADPQVVADGAQYLAAYGDSSSETALWERLQGWSATWKGREGELASGYGLNDARVWESALGDTLLQSLATGRGWLTDDAGFDRLAALSVTAGQRQSVEQWRKQWDERPRPVRMSLSPVAVPLFYFAQYDSLPLEDAVAKLAQFPAGTVFVWAGEAGNADETTARGQLRERLASHEIVIR